MFKKLFFTTDNEESTVGKPKYVAQPGIEQEEEFDTSQFNLNNVVPILDIYTKENIQDLTRSIFKVEEIKEIVPVELASDIKKKTVLGMLTVSGFNVSDLLTDASLRLTVIESAKNAFNEKADDSIREDELTIITLEEEIDRIKQNINTTKINRETQNSIIDVEVTRINNIIKFIE